MYIIFYLLHDQNREQTMKLRDKWTKMHTLSHPPCLTVNATSWRDLAAQRPCFLSLFKNNNNNNRTLGFSLPTAALRNLPHACARSGAYIRVRARTRPYTYTYTYTYTHAHPYAHARPHTRTRTHTRTPARTPAPERVTRPYVFCPVFCPPSPVLLIELGFS